MYSAFILQSQELDQKIAETWKHIQTERKILEATQLLRQATSNQDVLRRNEAKIRETERSLAYFEDTLGELQARKAQFIQRDDPSRFPGGPVPQVRPLSILFLCFSLSGLQFNRSHRNNMTHLEVDTLAPPRWDTPVVVPA